MDWVKSAASPGIAAQHAAESTGEMAGMTEAESLVKLLYQISIAQEQKCVSQFLLIKPLLGRHAKAPKKVVV